MQESDGSVKPPQISQMFQNFAFSFKSKALEFFTDDPQRSNLFNENPQEINSNQEFDEIKQNPSQEIGPICNKGKVFINPQFNQTLITSIFATISSFEAFYLQLQTAHVVNFDKDVIINADLSLVSHLKTLSDFKELYRNYYQNPNFNVEFSNGSCLEFQINENQHRLRALKGVFNNLQAEIDVKDELVSNSRRKLEEIEKGNLKLMMKLNSCCESDENDGGEILLSIRVFERLLSEVFRLSHRFSKALIGLMKKAHWDLDLVANSLYNGVDYVKEGDTRYALLSYVCLQMFQGFDLVDFGLGDIGGVCTGEGVGKNCLRKYKEHVSGDPMDMLRNDPNCEFSKFSERKFQELIHPTMESTMFSNLDQDEAFENEWESLNVFYEMFVKMASSVWALNKLAFSFDPPVDIFQVDRNVDFSMVYMGDVTKRCKFPCKTRPKVGFTVVPGFMVGQIIIQSQVYLTGLKLKDCD